MVDKVKEEVKEVTVEEYMNELVPFEAIFDGEKYKDDITMSINGKTWQIRRGITVMMPRHVKKAIMDTDRQKMAASATSARLENKFQQLAKQEIL
jgi:hypothetical protein